MTTPEPKKELFRQLVYISQATGGDHRADYADILNKSRLNNGINGVSGVLWTNGREYLQVIEGTPESIAYTMDRIQRDPRHHSVTILSDEVKPDRVFGDWMMASLLPGESGTELCDRLDRMLAYAPDQVRTAFKHAQACA